MARKILLPTLVSTLLLSACGSADAPDQPASPPVSETPAPAATPASPSTPPVMVSPVGQADAVNDGYPDLTPAPLTPEAERGEQGARNLLISWARAIELEEYEQAWKLMGSAGQKRWSEDQFEDLFDDLDSITVDIRGGQMEGAAGSSFYTVPTAITATDTRGHPVRFKGEAVLRRINDVPGATPEQLRWHFDKVELVAAR